MGPPEMGMDLVSGHETAVEMIPIAYGLEEGLADKIDHDWQNAETYDADDGSVTDW